jgi:hypothetical protein
MYKPATKKGHLKYAKQYHYLVVRQQSCFWKSHFKPFKPFLQVLCANNIAIAKPFKPFDNAG